MPATHREVTWLIPLPLYRALEALSPESGAPDMSAFSLWLLDAALKSFAASLAEKKSADAVKSRMVLLPEELAKLRKGPNAVS